MHQVHNRFAIFHQGQHPFKHTLADFAYSNPALPGVSNTEGALNYILAVLYPQTKAPVNTPADLPASGNTINDYRIVYDDGDGNAASYRWEQREGEPSPSWHKIYDMDWGSDSVLSAFYNIAQESFVIKRGRTDYDGAGSPITGIFAGQRIWGGNLSGQNLTLDGNSIDATGFVQTTNTFRPTADNALDLGTSALSWKTGYFKTSAVIGTLTVSPANINDSSGALSFNALNLTTTGSVTSSQFKTGTLQISDGSITDTDGTINFGATALTTSGAITAGAGSQLANLTFNNGAIISGSGVISFGASNVSTTGTLSAGSATFSQVAAGNLQLAVNTLSSTNTNGNIIVSPNGTGIVDIQSNLTTLGIGATGVVTVSGQLNADNLRLDGNVLSSTNANGNIIFTPNGTGQLEFSALAFPSVSNSLDLGKSGNVFRTLFLGTSITDGTDSISIATLLSLRDINAGVTAGMSLFYDGTKWVASTPDTEITHNTLSGLTTGDAGHTQFALLAGRAGGQTLVGGTAAGELLVLESTSNAAKGTVQTKDHFSPFTSASFSGTWSGTDLGTSTRYFRDLYTKGELKGARLENFTFSGLPSSSAQNVGRMAWTTDLGKMYIDSGAGWKVAGSSKYINDETFDGVQTSKTVTVSASVTDARNAIWALHDNANNFEQVFCTITKTSATQVVITTNGALPAGSYRLIGIE